MFILKAHFSAVLAIVSLFTTLPLHAATIVSAGTGNFNNGDSWVGGIAPSSGDSVVVLSDHIITVTADASIKSLCLYSLNDGLTAHVIINSGITLTVSDYVRLQSEDAIDAPISRLDIKGNLTIGKDLYLTTSVDGISSHVVVNMNIASTTPVLSLEGTIVNEGVGGSINANSSVTATLKMTGSTSKTLTVSGTALRYHHIIIDKSGGATVTLGGALTSITFRGNFTINNGKFDNGGYAIAGVSGKTFTVKNGTTFILSGTTNLPTTVSSVFENGSTVEFSGTNNINNNQTYHNVIISGTGTKTITGGDITVNGNLTLSAGTLDASTSNYGISIKGNWVNSGGTFTSRSGTVTFSGTSNQAITSNGNNFYNVVINNSATQVSLNDNLSISNQLTLTDAVITTGSYRVIMLSNSSTCIGGYSSASFINGNLRRYIATNTNVYAFPVGNGTGSSNYFRADMTNGNLSGITYIDARFKTLTGHNDSEMDVADEWTGGGLYYTSINTAGVWELEPNATPSGGSYDIKLYITNMSGLADNEFGPLKRPVGSTSGADWTTGGGTLNNHNGDGRLVAHGYMIRRGLGSFSEFGAGSGTGQGVGLPISLVNFTAQYKDKFVEIKWITATETNNDFFTVERSSDGVSFETLNVFEAVGNSSEENEYYAVDRHPLPATSYYRLKQTDLNGAYSYSEIIPVYHPGASSCLSVCPNPLSGRNVTVRLLKGANEIMLTDLSGKTIFFRTLDSPEETWREIQFPDNITSGLYFFTIRLEEESINEKLIIQ